MRTDPIVTKIVVGPAGGRVGRERYHSLPPAGPYSSGQYGFSVQADIHFSCSNAGSGWTKYKHHQSFGDKVGWRIDDRWTLDPTKINYETLSIRGHLPFVWCLTKFRGSLKTIRFHFYDDLYSRIRFCRALRD